MENCGNHLGTLAWRADIAKALPGEIAKRRSAVPSTELRACSACAGDYEDPDRTAWPVDEKEGDAEQSNDEFPEKGSR